MKRKRWNNESGIIRLNPNWKQEIIKAFTKYNIPYKQKVKDLEKALRKGEAILNG